MKSKQSKIAAAVAICLASAITNAATYTNSIISKEETKYVGAEDSTITIKVDSGIDAIYAENKGQIYIGGAKTDSVNIWANTTYDAVSAITYPTPQDKVFGTLVDIQANDSVTINSESIGLWAQSGKEEEQTLEKSATINISADNISIESKDTAIIAYSNSRVNLNGNHITINSQSGTALDVRGYSIVNIGNSTGNSTVVINGDICFETPKKNSGLIIDSYVNITLNGPDSYWNGNVSVGYPTSSVGGPDNYTSPSNLRVSLTNGAQWTPRTITSASDTVAGVPVLSHGHAVNFLTLSGGVINLTEGANQVVEIENLSGTGGILNIKADTSADGSSISAGTVKIDKISSSTGSVTDFTINYTGITSDDLVNIQQQIEELSSNSVVVADGSSSQTHIIKEGNIRGSVTLNKNTDGTVSEITTSQNSKLSDFRSANALSLVQWRNEINHLTKRLGDIRNSRGTVGAWARVYGGESQWGDHNTVNMNHSSIQVGGDYRINDKWLVGGAFSYTDSDATLVNGSADGESYSLAAYATYLADNGVFIDLIGRYGYLKNDISTGNMSLKNSSNAFSLSVESGHQFRFLGEQGYVEPQIELTYGFIAGDDSTASNGVRIKQDDFQSLVTRVGVRAGFDFPEKAGTVYATVSYSYDFMGDADGSASQDGLIASLNESLGGAWISYGIGAQFKIGDSSFAYGELERTSGGEIDNPYLFNCGFRWTF